MKHFICSITIVLLFTFILLPFVAKAITGASYDSDFASFLFQPVSNNQFYYEGPGDSGWTWGHHQYQNNWQQKINALGNTASASVFMPVLFGVGIKNISPNFGVPRSGGWTHEGEDIMAAKGTPVVSPTPAIVVHTGVGITAGNYVYTANPGGETFVYMHLDHIGEGVVSGFVLGQGSLIGYVGNTGNASGGAAHLHFEIHNSSDTPTDPFLRLTKEFSLQEKISYLSTILAKTLDSVALSQFLVKNFRSTFTTALAANITLPITITNSLGSTSSASAPASAVAPPPTSDLTIGSSGAAVVALQKYLIQVASGIAAKNLANVGATGYFGVMTKAALVEFQTIMDILPANGYYGLATRVFIGA